MWPSIVFQPTELAKSMIGARVWERATPVTADERVDYAEAAAPLSRDERVGRTEQVLVTAGVSNGDTLLRGAAQGIASGSAVELSGR